VLAAHAFEELRPTAETRGQLSRTQLITRGAVLGQRAAVPPGASVAPGSVL